MKILITGAGGQLARTLLALKPASHTVIALTHRALDITDVTACQAAINQHQPEIVINAAAYNQVDFAETERSFAHAVNTLGPQHLADSLAKQGGRLVHVSTDFVFSGQQALPYRLDETPAPCNYYGTTKYLGEQAVLKASPHNLVFRTAWLYSDDGTNFVTTMLRLLETMPHISVVSDQIGTPTWTGSLALAIWRAIEQPKLTGIQHLTDAGVASRYDFACAIRQQALSLGLLSQAATISPIVSHQFPKPAARPACVVLDKMPTWAALDITPIHWQETLLSLLTMLKKKNP